MSSSHSKTDLHHPDRRHHGEPVEHDRRDPCGGDRREAQRLDLELWIEELAADAVYFRCAANLGEGGVYFDHAVPYPLGTVVTLRFSLPGEAQPLVARGEVVSATRGAVGMGLRFVDFDGDDEQRLQSFVERLA